MIEKNVYFNRLGISVTYWIGQNAKDNFDILDKADENDLWFHLYNQPSCHVIARLPGKLDRDDLHHVRKQGAVLCKQYSRFASAKNVNIIYTYIKNIEKSEVEGSVRVTQEKTITI
jgi:predicted ribosome quality control (RQC) complex YloA/Tae2 family protein